MKTIIGVSSTDDKCQDFGCDCPLDKNCHLKGFHMCKRHDKNPICLMCGENNFSREDKKDFIQMVSNAGFNIAENSIRHFINIKNGRCIKHR